MASATTQPTRNTGPFTRARWENSIKVTAMIGTGLIATPTANVRISLIPSPILLGAYSLRAGGAASS